MSGFILPAFGVMFRELTLEELKAQIKLLSRPEWRMATRRFNAVYLVALKAQAQKIGAAFGVKLSRQRL